MILSGKDEIINHVKLKAPKSLVLQKKSLFTEDSVINRKSFRNITFKDDIQGIVFKNCKFTNCKFENIFAFYMILENCEFNKCDYRNSRFSHLEFCWDNVKFEKCFFRNVQLDEGALYNIFFLNCQLYSFNLLGFIPTENLCFYDCYIENGQFQSIVFYDDDSEIDYEYEDIIFQDCSLDFTSFNSVDFINSRLIDNTFFKTSFTNCRLNTNTIIETKENDNPKFALIDLETIILSENIESSILKKYFRINDNKVKDLIQQITTEKKFSSVFISYSFNDKEFANRLNSELTKHGIKTFLWEKDAPGGKRLEDIMSYNIKNHDRIIFIASSNSIKSKACQFELSQGRKKQEDTWETIFYPVHIDNFLFEVKKNQIRPMEKAKEYWENIEEIKRINSKSLMHFNTENFESELFTKVVSEIVEELKL